MIYTYRHLYLYIYIYYVDIDIIYIYIYKLPKWLRNICLTKKCVFSDFENIAHCCYNGFEEDIYYIYIYIYIASPTLLLLFFPCVAA